jgi:hypothetical protein
MAAVSAKSIIRAFSHSRNAALYSQKFLVYTALPRHDPGYSVCGGGCGSRRPGKCSCINLTRGIGGNARMLTRQSLLTVAAIGFPLVAADLGRELRPVMAQA